MSTPGQPVGSVGAASSEVPVTADDVGAISDPLPKLPIFPKPVGTPADPSPSLQEIATLFKSEMDPLKSSIKSM